jgi:hypothetical protein
VVSSHSSATVEYAPEFFLGVNRASINRKILHGSDFKLNCESHEFQEATVKWFYSRDGRKNKTALSETSKILSLQKMRQSVAGFYECIVGNSIGNSSKVFRVVHWPNGKLKIY